MRPIGEVISEAIAKGRSTERLLRMGQKARLFAKVHGESPKGLLKCLDCEFWVWLTAKEPENQERMDNHSLMMAHRQAVVRWTSRDN